jgi:YHS domain-containing protein
MKNTLILLFLGVGCILSAQSIDYNTDKGYSANGFDVVSYFNNTATEGSEKFITTHNGVKYRFSSQANLKTFKANSDKYIPQYGGYCSYSMGTSGEKASIDPETFEIRDGKLYLFYNSWGTNTLKSWLKKGPANLVIQANKNWDKIKYKK